ncbi:hypothetical protein FZ103_15370 [Streptomonospora sp. PA3]|uniref:hypothetical protein n=1 Tax=Streptomonospora sp. PA3 TaxID=2607326 RepID=UPI0012DD78E7|nr:hypothetical protein [Streptomonospora sp. PA3]MUL42535.1 hypothetical protein [Streptomonospora sp. PA3]
MDLLRAWTAGAAAWLAWAFASALLHLWLFPLGALSIPHLRLPWIACTTLTGYTLVALAAGLALPRSRRARSRRPPSRPPRPARRLVAVWTVPAIGAVLEAAAALSPSPSAANAAALLIAAAMITTGTALGSALSRRIRTRADNRA